MGLQDNYSPAANRKTQRISDIFTRPANVTAYGVKQIVGSGVTRSLNDVGYESTTGYIKKVTVIFNTSAVVPQLRLHLYNTTVTAIADQAAATVLFANRGAYLGYIDLPAMVSEGTGTDTSISQVVDMQFSFNLNSTKNLYYQLETLTAFTPTSGMQIYLSIDTTITG